MIDLIDFPIDITFQILQFRNLLVNSWPFLNNLMKGHDWEDDGLFSFEWIQVNWEFLIERELLGNRGTLVPLDVSDRITLPELQATYRVVCAVDKGVELRDWIKKTLNYEGEDLLIGGFSSRCDVTFGLYPPFDFVDVRTLDRKKMYIVPFDSCTFLLKPMQEV